MTEENKTEYLEFVCNWPMFRGIEEQTKIEEKRVTEENKTDYLELVCNWRFSTFSTNYRFCDIWKLFIGPSFTTNLFCQSRSDQKPCNDIGFNFTSNKVGTHFAFDFLKS